MNDNKYEIIRWTYEGNDYNEKTIVEGGVLHLRGDLVGWIQPSYGVTQVSLNDEVKAVLTRTRTSGGDSLFLRPFGDPFRSDEEVVIKVFTGIHYREGVCSEQT